MTKRLKVFLTILLGAMAIACLAAGCKVGQPDREEVLASYSGGHVTYYANGGYFDENTAIVVRDLYFKDSGSPFFDISEETGDINVMRSGYDFMGWFEPARYADGDHAGEIMYTYTYKEGENDITVPAYPKLNADGTVATDKVELRPLFKIDGSDEEILEKQVKVVPSEKAVDSTRILGGDEELLVCANWKPALKFVFKLAAPKAVKDGKTYNYGDVIRETAFGKEEEKDPGESAGISFEKMTFVANYQDEACTKYTSTYKRADYEGQTEIVVWSKFIDGYWTVIKNNPNKIRDMFTGLNKEGNRYYLLEDVDCSSITTFNSRGVLAEIEGNGHVLKNLNFKISTSFDNGLTAAPVFGRIYPTAKIKNLTLENITVSVVGKGEITFYAICSAIDEGATISGLKIDGVTAEVTVPDINTSVSNAKYGDRSNWLFGGKGTDEAFINAFGITVTGTNTLTIKL